MKKLLLMIAGVILSAPFFVSANIAVAPSVDAKSENEAGSLTSILISKSGTPAVVYTADQIKQQVQLAKRRREIMKQLAEKDPSAFLRKVIPAAMRSKLPADVQAQIEQSVKLTGKVDVLHTDDFTNHKNSRFDYTLRVGNSRLSLKMAGNPPAMVSNSLVSVSGYQLDQTVVAGTGTSGVSVLSTPAPEAVGTQNTLAILLTSAGYPATPSPAEMKANIFSGDFEKYYVEQSYGKVSFAGDVTDWISIEPYSGYCYAYGGQGISLDRQAIKDYIKQHNINLSQYGRVIFVLNGTGGGCSNVGKSEYSFSGATYKFSESWVGWPNSEYYNISALVGFNYVLSHEMGHGLGVMHANSWACQGPSLDTGCQHQEYGNDYDVMGTGAFSEHFNAFYKDLLGWLDSSSKISITKSGTYQLSPLESQAGVRAAIVTNPATPSSAPLYLEFRQPRGYDAGLNSGSVGLQLNQIFMPANSYPFPRLINANHADFAPPAPAPQYPLVPGKSFAWDSHGISIGSLNIASTTALFNVGLTQPVCSRNDLSILDIGYPTQVAAGNGNSYFFTIVNNDTPACDSSDISVSMSVSDSSGWTFDRYYSEPFILASNSQSAQQPGIFFSTPADTPIGNRTINITVNDTTHGRTFNFTHQITVNTPPVITSITPASGKIGTSVTIAGTGFAGSYDTTIGDVVSGTNVLTIYNLSGQGVTALLGINSHEGTITFNFPSTLSNEKGEQVLAPNGTYSIYLYRYVDNGSSKETRFEVTDKILSILPVVEFVGAPTLKLTLDKQKKESMLVGSAKIKVTAGDSPISFYPTGVGGKSALFSLYNATRGESSGSYAGSGTPATIPAGKSVTFTTTVNQTVKTLFAGSYTLVPEGLQYYANGGYQLVSKDALKNARSSNSVTIVGETSPYIGKVYSDATSRSGGYVVDGVRFHPTSNQVTINGITKTLKSTSGATMIMFKPSDYKLVSGTVYSVQVKHPTEGLSNNLMFQIATGAVTPANDEAVTIAPVMNTISNVSTPASSVLASPSTQSVSAPAVSTATVSSNSRFVATTTAALTVNGVTSVAVSVGDPINWVWNSTGATSYSSKVTASGCSVPAMNTIGGTVGWVPSNLNTARGAGATTIDSAWAGCDAVVVYTVTGANGTRSASVAVHIMPIIVPVVPTVASTTLSSVSTTTATLGANVVSLGIPVSISARGVCFGVSQSPTTNCVPAPGVTTGLYALSVSGLAPGTLYYYRGYAVNTTGTGYSSDGTFTTIALPPVPTAALTVNGVASTTVSIGDTINYSWSSSGGTIYSSTYTVTGCALTSANKTTSPWSAASPGGSSSSGVIPSSWARCTSTITYTVSGPGGSASSIATIHVNPLRSSSAPVPSSSQFANVFGVVSSAPATPAWAYSWTHNLEIGSPYTADNTALQTALVKEGVYSGEMTGGFYSQTYNAVKTFQSKYGIESTGFVGPQTRAKLNELYQVSQ